MLKIVLTHGNGSNNAFISEYFMRFSAVIAQHIDHVGLRLGRTKFGECAKALSAWVDD